MKTVLRTLALGVGVLLFLPLPAHAAGPSISAISDITLNAGATLTVNVVAVDVDGDAITLTSSAPAFATLNAPTTGTGVVVTTMALAPTAGHVGTHSVTLTATAGGQTDTESFDVVVAAAGSNAAPVVTAPASLTVTEGAALTFEVTASDADADVISTLAATGLPSGAAFTPNASNTSGTFTWTPSSVQAGEYDVAFTATNSLQGAATTHIHVANANLYPVSVAEIADVTLAEGGTLIVNVTATDADNGTISLTSSLPSFATLNAPTSSTGTGSLATTIDIHPGAGTAGTYTASVTASAEGQTDTEGFTITVTGGGENHAPDVTAPPTQTVNEGQTLTFTVSASDADADHVALTASGVPSGATFNDLGNNTGTFTWTPSFTQSGTYTVTFTGNDGEGGTDASTTAITVNNVSVGGQVEARATLFGKIHRNKKFLCFRIRPLNESFDLRDVVLSGIVFRFNGSSVNALSGKTHLQLDCDDDDDDGDDCEECDDDGDEDCERDDDDDDDDEENCVATGIRACFAARDIFRLFDGQDIRTNLVNATLEGTLTTGQTFVATIEGARFAHKDDHEDGKKKGLRSKASPNPLNPKTELTFTLSQPGRVRVAVYDLQGRLVKTLLDENRPEGAQSLFWDGSDSGNRRVASGVYFFRITAPQGEEVERVAVLK